MFHRITRSHSHLALVAALALAAGFAGVARAGSDGKMYPGAFCQQAGTSQTLWYFHGRAVNTSTSSKIADCPMLTDSPYGLYKGKAYVYVVDRNYSQDFSCTILAYDQYAPSPSYSWSNRRSAGSGESVQVLTYDFSKAPMNNRVWSPMLLGCEIPGSYSGNRSDLISYLIFEYETDGVNSSQ